MATLLIRRAAIMASLLIGVVIGASDPDTAVRNEFTQALAAAGTETSVVTDSTALQSYVLYPYLQAARLKRALSRGNRDIAALDQAIQSWLAVQGSVPVTTELRRLWLLDLAARQRWSEFQANLPVNTSDVELRCLAATALLSAAPTAEQLAAMSNTLVAIWMNANRLPAACNTPFEWARGNQVINAELIEQRARLVLKAGNVELARELAGLLPAARAEPLQQWAGLIDKPQAAIDALMAQPRITVEPAAAQDGWSRLARKDPEAALQRWSRWTRTRGLTRTAASPYALSLALALSWSRHDSALRYFTQVLPADMTEQAFEWQVRAALWAGDWTRVEKGIQAMPEALRTQARWRYWLARARQRHDAGGAAKLYQGLIAGNDNYYAAMAAARLPGAYTPHVQPLPDDNGMVRTLAVRPGMQRARELLAVQQRDSAGSEWAAAFATLQPGEHVAAARLAREWGWYDQAVATAARLGLYNDYPFLYPQPYAAEVAEAARLSGLPAELIYGVMRQETLFRADARSAANAMGLLQLVPETARATARKFKLPVPAPEQLFEPAVNVPLGALNLRVLLDSCAGQIVPALAAYNAGPVAMRRWLPTHAMDADIWIENIPYNETRSYVQRVLWHSLVFYWLREQKPLDTHAWLAPVQP